MRKVGTRVAVGANDLKTHDGWALIAGTGKRAMVPPDDPPPSELIRTRRIGAARDCDGSNDARTPRPHASDGGDNVNADASPFAAGSISLRLYPHLDLAAP